MTNEIQRIYNGREIKIGRFDKKATKYIIAETADAYIFEARAECEKHIQIHESLKYLHKVRGGGRIFTPRGPITLDEVSGEYSCPFTQNPSVSNREPMEKLIQILKEETGKEVILIR